MEQTRRHSKKRDAILSVIQGTKSHPSADWIYEQIRAVYPDISLGTVYRNLSLFKDDGLVRVVTVVNGTERFDANVLPHPHFACRQCGAVIDITVDFSMALSKLASSGFTVENCDITYHGLCPSCTKNKN